MPHFLVTAQMHYRQMFLVEADSDEHARANYAEGVQSDYFHTEPEIVAVELVEAEKGAEQLSLFGNE